MTRPILDLRKDRPEYDRREAMRRTTRETGKSMVAQALEILRQQGKA